MASFFALAVGVFAGGRLHCGRTERHLFVHQPATWFEVSGNRLRAPGALLVRAVGGGAALLALRWPVSRWVVWIAAAVFPGIAPARIGDFLGGGDFGDVCERASRQAPYWNYGARITWTGSNREACPSSIRVNFGIPILAGLLEFWLRWRTSRRPEHSETKPAELPRAPPDDRQLPDRATRKRRNPPVSRRVSKRALRDSNSRPSDP